MSIKVLNLLCESSDAATSISTVHTQIDKALNEPGFECETRYLCGTSRGTGNGFLEQSIPLKTLRRPRRHPILMRRLKRALRDHVEVYQPDLIILDGLYSAECLLSMQAISCPVLMLVHGRTHFHRKHLRHLSRAPNPGFPVNWRLVFVSSEAQTYWQSKHPKISPAQSVIENCIRAGELQSELLSPDAARAALGVPPTSFTVGAIARLSAEKNLSQLLNAFAKVDSDQLHCLLIGEGKERDTLQALAKQLGIEQRCLFVGFKDKAYQYLSAFDLFVMSSVTEGSPIALLEAMAAGNDVLCSDIETLRDISLPTECYFDLNDTEDLASKISQRATETNRSNRQKRIDTIAKIVNTRFSPQRFNENYQNLVREMF